LDGVKSLLDGNTKNVDREHNNQQFGARIVENFIARDDDPDFIPGSWVAAIHVADPITWSNIKAGYINGVSLDGDGERGAQRNKPFHARLAYWEHHD
jgi:hypothetical protein